jgi:large subunit ribosomal protein L28
MAIPGKHCEICDKGAMRRNMVSHSHRVAKRRAQPNLKRIRIQKTGRVVLVWVCAKCLKKGRVVPALSRRLTRPEPKAAS